MLRDMSVSEYFYWARYFGRRPFMLEMLDYGFGLLASSAYNVAAGKPLVTGEDFSVLASQTPKREMSDTAMMEASSGVLGVTRIGSD